MNKKSMAKIGAVSVLAVVVLVLIFFLLIPLLSSEEIKKEYVLGDKLRIDVGGENIKVKVQGPSDTYLFNVNNSLVFKLEEIGNYQVGYLDFIYNFKVVGSLQESETKENITGSAYSQNIKEGIEKLRPFNPDSFLQNNTGSPSNWSNYSFNGSLITIGEPVQKLEKIVLNEIVDGFKYKIPSLATNISVKSNGETIEFQRGGNFFQNLLSLFSDNSEEDIVLRNVQGEIEIDYTLPGPEKIETIISDEVKIVSISAPDIFNYENVIASSELPFPVASLKKIYIYWEQEGMYIPFEALDLDSDGLYDHVQWIVPHLSEQTFEIIIEISKAEHLDENKSFIEDIYSEVSALDDIFKEIPQNHYVRISFEQNLTSEKDITIYARSNSGARVEVYEKDSDNLIAEFENVFEFKKYQIILTNLSGSQDTFDLKIIGESVEFDYIVDPVQDTTLDFTNITNNRAFVDAANNNGVPPAFTDGWSGAELSSGNYGSIATNNNAGYSFTSGGGNREPYLRYNFTINVSTSRISWFYVTMKQRETGGGASDEHCYYYIANFATSTWNEVGSYVDGVTYVTRTNNYTSNIANYISGNQIVLMTVGSNMDSEEGCDVDYLSIRYYATNTVPTHSTPLLNSSTGLNSSDDNLTVYNQSTADSDGDLVKNIINWYVDNVSLEALNLPFEGGSNSAFTKDYSGNSNNGTVNGATFSSTSGFDGFGAYTFVSGSSNYISISSSQSLNFSISCEFTEMAWIKPVHSDAGWHGFLGYEGGGTATRMPSMWIYDNNEIHAGFGDGSEWRSFTTSSNPITEGDWNHVVATFDGTYYLIYVNGVIEYNETGAWTGVCPNPSYAQLDVGRVDNYFNGSIDDVRVYNRSLSAEQVSAIYHNRTDLMVSEETSSGDFWKACITPNDRYVDGSELCSNTISLADTSPPVISNIVPANLSSASNPVTLSANTNEDADCEYSTNYSFNYGTGSDFSSGQGTTAHSTSLGSFSKGQYTYYIKCNDSDSNYNTNINQGDTTFNVSNDPPTQATPVLNSTYGTNYAIENLTCYNQSTSDPEGNSVKNVFVWKLNGSGFDALVLPFEGSSTSAWTRDYANANNGSVHGATWENNTGFDGFGAYTFVSGSSNYISISSSQSLNFSISCEFTEMAWIKPVHSDAGWHGFLGYAGAGSSTRMPSMWIYDNNEIHAGFGDGSEWRSFTTSSNPITEGDWNHVVATFDGTYYLIYVNGVIEYNETGAWTGVCPNPSYAQLDVGRVDNYFNGSIDDVRVYNRSLSAEQIFAIYSNKTNLVVVEETSVGDIWQCSIIPNDGAVDGSLKSSNSLTIVERAGISVNIVYPTNTTYSTNVTRLNYTVSVDWSTTLDKCWYSLNGGANSSSQICMTNWTGITSQEGANIWRVYANDTGGRLGVGNVSFTVDTIAPDINFVNQSDQNNNSVNSTNPLYEGQNLTIYANVSDINTDKVWVIIWNSLKGGSEKVRSFFSYVGGFLWKAIIPTDATWDLLNYNYTIYTNDSASWSDEYDWNFSLLKMNISLDLSPSLLAPSSNFSIYGYVNLTNSTSLPNHPINIWLEGGLLLFSNVTAIGTYNNYLNFTDTSSSSFNLGTYFNTETDGDNVTLGSGQTSGNYTRILDAGARVEWNNVLWVETFPSCSARLLTFQDGDANGYLNTHDTYLDSGNANTNYGTEAAFLLDTAPSTYRSLIKFDGIIGSGSNKIPQNSIISAANITVVVFDDGNDVTVYEILENWTESQATYNNRLTGTSWSSTGCAAAPSRDGNPQSTFSPSAAGSYTFNVTNAMKRWVNGTSQNYGVVLNPGGGNNVDMRSSEFGTQNQRPLLSVSYIPSSCTNITVYVRLSNDKSSWTSWQQISNGGVISDSGGAYRYLEYRVDLSSDESTLTPYFQEAIVNYTAITTDANGYYRYNLTSSVDGGIFSVNVNTYFSSIFGNASVSVTVTGTPSVLQLNAPQNNSFVSSSPILNWTNSTDYEGDFIRYILVVDNDADFSSPEYYNDSINETTSPTGVNPGLSVDGFYYWRVRAYDRVSGNSSWSNIWKFTLDSTSPELTFLNQSDEDNLTVNDSNPLMQGENLTIYINASDTNLDKVWIVVWQTVKGGVEKVKIFFTYLGGFLWKAIIPTDTTWDLLNYNYTIYANDSVGLSDEYDGNFSLLKTNMTLLLSPNPVDSITNISISGFVNFTNSTYIPNHPINIWFNGSLLLFANVTSNGVFNNYLNFTDGDSGSFNFGTYVNTTTDGANITLLSGSTSGNYTRVLDAGARVEWDNVVWQYTGGSCSGLVTYQDGDTNGYSGTEDTYIDDGAPTSNYGTDASLGVDSSPVQRSLIKFMDVVGYIPRGIPYGATINAANITVELFDSGNDVSIYEILENWTESQATYNNRLTGTSWGSTGCAASPSRSTFEESTFSGSSTGSRIFDITNAMRRWINGSSQNYGVVLHPGGSNGVDIRSSEYSTQGERPLLTVSYSSSDCTNITVYVRLSNDKSSWTSWQQISNGGIISDSGGAYRYLEYRVDMKTTNSSLKPYLNELVVNYTAITTNESGYYDYNITSPTVFGDYAVVVNTSYRTMYASTTDILSIQLGVDPEVHLISPLPGQWFSYGNLNLTYNTTDVNGDIVNSTLIINGQANQTNSTVINDSNYNNFIINFGSGQYNWTVNVTDSNSNVGTDSVRTFYIDLEDPNVTLIYPPNESSYSVGTLNLSFNVTDNMDSVLSCSVVLDGNTISSPTPNNNSNTNVSSGALSNGIHYWNVTCTDNALRSFTSSTQQFNISDTPPTVTLQWPYTNYFDSDGNISFIFNASDNSGFQNCSLIINGSVDSWNQTAILNNQNNTINKTDMVEGSYTWNIGCYDLSGNYDSDSARNFYVDLNYPTIDLYMPFNGNISNSSSIGFNFTVNDSFDSSLVCNLTINSIAVDNFSATAGLFTNRPINNLTDGVKYWNVTCVDDARHLNVSSMWNLTISAPPVISLITQNESSYGVSSVNLTYYPSDNTNLSNCSLYLNGEYNQSNSSQILNWQNNNFTVNGLSDGTYLWYVNCSDVYNLSAVSETKVFYIDTQPPEITLSYPNEQNIYSEPVIFNFTAVDAVDLTLTCNLSVDGGVRNSSLFTNNASVKNVSVSGISDGLRYWNVTCWDSAGNIGNSSTYNFTKYSNPVITLTYPGGGTWFNYSSLNLTYVPEDNDDFAISYLIINGQVNQTNTTPIVNYDYNNFTIIGFPDGEYNWTVIATDGTGLNGTDVSRIFYIDTQTPKLSLNSPDGSSTIATNNVTFNFTVIDNLDEGVFCNLTLDEEIEYSDNSTNSSEIINYILVADGNHTWNVTCVDKANNFNYSESINVSVVAPPSVALSSPPNNNMTNLSTISFYYTPYDAIGIDACDIYLDGSYNDTDDNPVPNQQNNFTISGISEGRHNWTVNCSDPDGNFNWSNEWYFTRDITPPNISLDSPTNNSGIYFGTGSTVLSWTANDSLDTVLRCNLYVDEVLKTGSPFLMTSGFQRQESFALSLGWHNWSTRCWDRVGNTANSSTYYFNFTYPDFIVNSSSIVFNDSVPREGDIVLVNVSVYNQGGVNMSGVNVVLYDGNPDTGGTQIGSNTLSILKFGLNTTTFSWTADLGASQIFALVDPPLATNGSYKEWNETNNNYSESVSTGAWHFFYGNIDVTSNYTLQDLSSSKLVVWSASNFEDGNVYLADTDSIVSWTDLLAIGKNTTGSNTTDDFSDIDALLNMTGFTDSVYALYTDTGTPRNISDYNIFKNVISEVSEKESINNSNFMTGILWDSNDDSNGEFSQGDRENLVFVSKINKDTQGAYGVYDYEIRVPARLRGYKSTTDSYAVVFYVELK